MDYDVVGLKGSFGGLGTPLEESSTLYAIENTIRKSSYGSSCEGLELGTDSILVEDHPYVWLPTFGILRKELLEGPECQDIRGGMSTVLGNSEAPDMMVTQAEQGKLKDLPSEYLCPRSSETTTCLSALANADTVDRSGTSDMDEKGDNDDPCMLPSTHKGIVCSEGLTFRVISDADCQGYQRPNPLPRFGEGRVRKELALLLKGAL
ncbi:hypothetical protein Pmar_PMAR000975 [Perkinsus marinus ATCC 50983]|uniref:Uncharacterized protein n=1 Tax=Perkinsus marinus (strain ATCC 50983 / TXsc) TaxID=423536 RepID=C5KP24_PERM5|nr:hypothetical protein Pmar_PMAR000975 [Perkinsus marinus ATCC 50983]EER13812.1 hypothetical protein Pmar_PMAR000975 [Perkinsus marinus ATCC 50983]|eukprot:XP_002782017.1 hypothetical protein Pmar_PMAR000975 [Perkinsus marinus ATCC 50983]